MPVSDHLHILMGSTKEEYSCDVEFHVLISRSLYVNDGWWLVIMVVSLNMLNLLNQSKHWLMDQSLPLGWSKPSLSFRQRWKKLSQELPEDIGCFEVVGDEGEQVRGSDVTCILVSPHKNANYSMYFASILSHAWHHCDLDPFKIEESCLLSIISWLFGFLFALKGICLFLCSK